MNPIKDLRCLEEDVSFLSLEDQSNNVLKLEAKIDLFFMAEEYNNSHSILLNEFSPIAARVKAKTDHPQLIQRIENIQKVIFLAAQLDPFFKGIYQTHHMYTYQKAGDLNLLAAALQDLNSLKESSITLFESVDYLTTLTEDMKRVVERALITVAEKAFKEVRKKHNEAELEAYYAQCVGTPEGEILSYCARYEWYDITEVNGKYTLKKLPENGQ